MNIANIIRNLIIRATAEGVDQTANSLKGLAQAHDQAGKSATAHAQASETSARRQLSMEQAFDRLERRFNTTIRAQQDYAKVQSQVNAAVAQNPALQARANDLLARAADHYNQAAAAQSLFARSTQLAQDQAAGLASRAGAAGSALMALGPAGLAAAAGIGATVLVFGKLIELTNELADKSGKMVDFAETTGLTTTQLQALTKAGAQVGVESDKIGRGFERFSVQLEELKGGSGELYKSIQQINPALINQMAAAKDAAVAWDLLAQAYAEADKGQQNVLSKAAFGQRNIGMGRLLGASAEAGGIGGLQGNLSRFAPSQEDLKRWDELSDKITEIKRDAGTIFTAMFSDEILNMQLSFYMTLLKIVETMREIKESDWFKILSSVSTVGRPGANLFGNFGGGREAAQPQADLASQLGSRDIAASAPSLAGGDLGIAKYKQLLEILGPAASASEKLQLQVMQLDQQFLKGQVSVENYQRALAALGSQSTAGIRNRIADLQFENSLMGRSADQVAAMRVEWEALRTVREQAIAAGLNEEQVAAAVEREKDAMSELIQQLQAANAERERQKQVTEDTAAAQQRLNQRRQEEAQATAEATRAYNAHKAALEQIAAAARSSFSTTFNINGTEASYYGSGGSVFPGSGMNATQGKNIQNAADLFPGSSWQAAQGYVRGGVSLLGMGDAMVTTAGFEHLFNNAMKQGGGLFAGLDKLFSGNTTGLWGGFDFNQAIPVIQRVINLLPEDQKAANIERIIGEVSKQAPSLGQQELLAQLRDQLKALTDSTDSLNETMRDVLSPLYGADPRTTHIGYRPGSVYRPDDVITAAMMGGTNVLPGMASGGDFTVPGGYSAVDNMLLPVASGERISVSRGAESERPTIVVNAPITIESMTGDQADLRETAFQFSQQLAAAVRAGMARG